MEKHTTGSGQKLIVHSKEDCVGEYCTIHNPSMDWPTFWRSDWGGFMEYVCPCGVGYPAPEQAYKHEGFGNCGNTECLETYRDACERVAQSLEK